MPQTCKCSPTGPVYSVRQYAQALGRPDMDVYHAIYTRKLKANKVATVEGYHPHWEIPVTRTNKLTPRVVRAQDAPANGNGNGGCRADILDIVIALARFYPDKGIEKIVPAARAVDKELSAVAE